MRTTFTLLIITALAPACATDDREITKDDAREASGKSDLGHDYCEMFGWYGDDICDDFCPEPDPDCGEAFASFRLSRGGLCPFEMDCFGFISLDADGTLKFDRQFDPGGAVSEANITDSDLSDAIAVLTDATLVSMLAGDEPPCDVPQDVDELMSLEIGGNAHSNLTTFCSKPELEAVRDLLDGLAAKYFTADFVSFKMARHGFCAPAVDCTSSIELLADGTLRVDRPSELPVVIHQAQISADELTAALLQLTAPSLRKVLDAVEPPCSAPTDIFESMTLTLDDGEHRQSTTFCDQQDIAAARQLLNQLAQTHL